MGNAAPSSGMLAVFLVAMLVLGWTEGSMLSKCEVKSRLEAAFEALQRVTADDNLAKLVCTVEATSRFNTSLVTIIDPSRSGLLIRHGFPTDGWPTQEVIGDYFPEMFSKETLVTENPFSSPEVVIEDDGTSLIPEGMISAIPPEAVNEDFIPASRQPEGRLADASTQDNNPSEGNPIDSVDRQVWDHMEEKVGRNEINTREGSGEIIDFSGDYSGQGSKEELSAEGPLYPDIGHVEGSGDHTEEPLVQPTSTPEYPIDETFYPDSDRGHGSGDHTEEPVVPFTSSPEYPIDETFYPDSDRGHGSGDHTEEPVVPFTSSPEYPIDETFYPDSDRGHGSGDHTEEPVVPFTSSPEYPIDETFYPDSDRGHESGDHTEEPVGPITSSPEYPIDETFYPDYESGEGSGEGSGISPPFQYKRYLKLLFKRRIESSFKVTESSFDSREFLSDPHRQDLDLGDRPYNYRYGPLNPDDGPYDPSQNYRVLYGIFQLSDDVACQSESKYSWNLCNLDCTALIDDDISDDIECLMILKKQLVEMTFTEECHIVEPSGYFETCD